MAVQMPGTGGHAQGEKQLWERSGRPGSLSEPVPYKTSGEQVLFSQAPHLGLFQDQQLATCADRGLISDGQAPREPCGHQSWCHLCTEHNPAWSGLKPRIVTRSCLQSQADSQLLGPPCLSSSAGGAIWPQQEELAATILAVPTLSLVEWPGRSHVFCPGSGTPPPPKGP